jgi:hypothetical protein
MNLRALFFSFMITAIAVGAERWSSPDEFYSIIPPAGWKSSKFKGPSNFGYEFTSPDGNSEVSISAMYHVNLPAVLPERVLEIAFPNEHGIAQIKRIHSKGWDGLRREYTNTPHTKHWLGVTARRGSTVVLLLMQSPEKEFERYRATFEAVAESLQLRQ